MGAADLIDPRELAELAAALDAFDEAYVRVAQAGRRVLLLHQLAAPPPPVAREPVQRPDPPRTGYLGDPCPSCQALTLRFKGTCKSCDTCGWDTGCG